MNSKYLKEHTLKEMENLTHDTQTHTLFSLTFPLSSLSLSLSLISCSLVVYDCMDLDIRAK